MISSLLSIAAGAVAGALYATWVDRLARRSRREPLAVAAQGYAIGLMVAALLYALFPFLDGGAVPARVLVTEALGMTIFTAFALLGLQRHIGWLAAGWALHVPWDMVLHGPWAPMEFQLVPPTGYALLCIGFDLLVAAWIVIRWLRPLSSTR